jgi:hypothetical protein
MWYVYLPLNVHESFAFRSLDASRRFFRYCEILSLMWPLHTRFSWTIQTKQTAILAYPFQCEQRNPEPCQRGKHLGRPNFPDLYRFAFLLPIRCLVYVFLVVCLTLIYMKLRYIDSRSSSTTLLMRRSSEMMQMQKNEKNNKNDEAASPAEATCTPTTSATAGLRSSFQTATTTTAATTPPSPPPPRRSTLNHLTHQFATQAMLYCCAFFITWLFPTIGLIIGLATNGPIPPTVLLLSDLFTPLQGFWNAFIYLRPRYLRYRRRQREEDARQRQAQELADANRMARVARLLAQQGLAFVHALSVQRDNDGDDDDDDENDENDENDNADEEDEDYAIILSNAEETRIPSHG